MTRTISAFIAALALVSLSGCSGCGRDYSDGTRSGYVVKLSNKGLFWKSWEGSLHLSGGANGATGSDTWNFSVTRPELVPPLQEAQRSGHRVSLHYRQWAISPVSIETDYEVDSVEVDAQ